ncbi:TolB family protein [Streptomyces graminilatus]|uniref:TolB family protein n=1 Tax=Streptomyces graminilatus TaxID=1464070 RepID=UPI000D14E298|nr:PD40 domain-containing protein [Streptomyces graminilatus]
MSVAAVVAGVVALSGIPAASVAPRATERVTVSGAGEQGDSYSAGPFLSDNGRYAAFQSNAKNLVAGDTNGVEDAFVRDLRTGRVTRVSLATDGTQADAGTGVVDISADGRFVVLVSTATNLAKWPGPQPYWAQDVYVHDRRTGRTDLISRTPTGASSYAHGAAAISDDGRYVAFNARPSQMESPDKPIFPAVYVTDRRTGKTERITNRDYPTLAAYHLDLSADGRYVAYTQIEPRGGGGRLWVHDRRTHTEELVNVKPDGTPSAVYALDPSLSADGRTISFEYRGDDLVAGGAVNTGTYVRDLRTGRTRGVVHDGPGGASVFGPQLSRDGRYVGYVFAAPQGQGNAYVRDLRTGKSRLASPAVSGGPVTDEAVYITSFGGGDRLLGIGSSSAQLVRGDTNGETDGFVRRLR